jgi:hypothetical protein
MLFYRVFAIYEIDEKPVKDIEYTTFTSEEEVKDFVDYCLADKNYNVKVMYCTKIVHPRVEALRKGNL